MSQLVEEKRAESEFTKFRNRLLPGQLKYVPVGNADAPIVEQIEVNCQELLDCFLSKYPQFERFRTQLEERQSGRNRTVYSLDANRWQEAKE